MKKQWKWQLLASSLCLFALLAWWVVQGQSLAFDTYIYQALHSSLPTSILPLMRLITEFGGTVGIVLLCILALFVFGLLKRQHFGWLFVLNCSVSALINVVLKHVFVRQRPMINQLVSVSGYSFPSGHAMASTAFYGLLAMILWRNVKTPWLRNVLCSGCVLLVLLIMVSRVYLGVHYASDVLAGSLLSVAILILFTSAGKKVLGDRYLVF